MKLADIHRKQLGVAEMRVESVMKDVSGEITHASNISLAGFPSDERRLVIDGDSYEDLVPPVAVEIA